MYKFKFSNITFVSNKKYISKNKVIFFIYGIGNCSDDFKFILKKLKKIIKFLFLNFLVTIILNSIKFQLKNLLKQ